MAIDILELEKKAEEYVKNEQFNLASSTYYDLYDQTKADKYLKLGSKYDAEFKRPKKEGDERFKAGRYQSAINSYKEAIKRDPDDAVSKAKTEYAKVLMKHKDIDILNGLQDLKKYILYSFKNDVDKKYHELAEIKTDNEMHDMLIRATKEAQLSIMVLDALTPLYETGADLSKNVGRSLSGPMNAINQKTVDIYELKMLALGELQTTLIYTCYPYALRAKTIDTGMFGSLGGHSPLDESLRNGARNIYNSQFPIQRASRTTYFGKNKDYITHLCAYLINVADNQILASFNEPLFENYPIQDYKKVLDSFELRYKGNREVEKKNEEIQCLQASKDGPTPSEAMADTLYHEINQLTERKKKLGFFKGKEKKVIQAEIDTKTAERTEVLEKAKTERVEQDEKYNKQIENINESITESKKNLSAELKKRGFE